MADQNNENDRYNQNLRKTKKKTSFRIDFESLMTNMANVFASPTSKITEKTVTTVILNQLSNTKKCTNSIEKRTKNLLIHFEMVDNLKN